METKVELITPELAEHFLKLNTQNRPKSSQRVKALADLMRQGKWIFNGDAIRISKAGRLIDGQHRLSAIVESGCAQQYVLVTNLDDEAFKTIDVGSNRTAGDMLSIEGIRDYNNVAAAARLAISYERTGNPVYSAVTKQATKADIVEYTRTEQGLKLILSCKKIQARNNIHKICARSVLSFCHHEFAKVSPEKADQFIDEFHKGYYSYEHSPVAAVRDRLLMDKESKLTISRRAIVIAMLFKAFAYFNEGKSLKIIKLSPNKDNWFLL